VLAARTVAEPLYRFVPRAENRWNGFPSPRPGSPGWSRVL